MITFPGMGWQSALLRKSCDLLGFFRHAVSWVAEKHGILLATKGDAVFSICGLYPNGTHDS